MKPSKQPQLPGRLTRRYFTVPTRRPLLSRMWLPVLLIASACALFFGARWLFFA